MKKWLGKLKESDNYNILIPAMLVVLTVKFIWTIIATGNNIRQVVSWNMDMSEGLVYIIPSFISLAFMAITVYFVTQACNRDPKFMICAIVCSTITAVLAGFIGAIASIILGTMWLVSVRSKNGRRWVIAMKAIAIMLVVIVVVMVLKYVSMMFVIGHLGEWRTDSLEEGDWSQWETEETIDDFE